MASLVGVEGSGAGRRQGGQSGIFKRQRQHDLAVIDAVQR
jgi:hypothetical protein